MAFPQKKRTPSFSSSILDSIYRSIDESDGLQSDLRGGTINSNNDENVSSSSSTSSPSPTKKDDKLTTLRRAIMDEEHWLYPRSSTTTTNTSDSSAFSSSEAESYRTKRRSSKFVEQVNKSGDDKKVKAVKMHEELKRSKQPLSPGARLTSFLNSIFQSNAKKVKLCSVGKTTDVKSSSPRSCFSRTKHKTNSNNNCCKKLERSIRFYPVRVTIDGDCRDYTQKPISERTAKKSIERVVTSLKEDIKTKVHQTELTCVTRKIGLKDYVTSNRDEGNEDEDDVWSYSSSDLFELDSYRIGMGRYLKELPVYETTDFKTNQAIARGLLL
ncbi:hypothetical protein CARUB_v10017637mg [Capsella rubella]|uniref:Protein BIG GRAIN 1-like A n=1 Tax=Capsella rubella TaxID=81985 RepID=R0FQH1_9BRAS|nr:protein BIG GRAIN 1-like C [Capsella rubella]EOA24386.1 hypothetical protein CARUB_v10017637mg [Capsella rubella]